jgi:hypothetical protein
MIRLVTIILTQDVPVDPKHGMRTGRKFAAYRIKNPMGSLKLWSVSSDAGERVIVLSSEAKEIEENNG